MGQRHGEKRTEDLRERWLPLAIGGHNLWRRLGDIVHDRQSELALRIEASNGAAMCGGHDRIDRLDAVEIGQALGAEDEEVLWIAVQIERPHNMAASCRP